MRLEYKPASEPQELIRVRREVRVLRVLKHSNIVGGPREVGVSYE